MDTTDGEKKESNFFRKLAIKNYYGFDRFMKMQDNDKDNVKQILVDEREITFISGDDKLDINTLHLSYCPPPSACLTKKHRKCKLNSFDKNIVKKGGIDETISLTNLGYSIRDIMKDEIMLLTKHQIEQNWSIFQGYQHYVSVPSAVTTTSIKPRSHYLLGKRDRYFADITRESTFLRLNNLIGVIAPISNFSEIIHHYNDDYDGRYLELLKYTLNKTKNKSYRIQSHNDNMRHLPPPVPVCSQHPASWGIGNRRQFATKSNGYIDVTTLHPACMSSTITYHPTNYKIKKSSPTTSLTNTSQLSVPFFPRTSSSKLTIPPTYVEENWDELNIEYFKESITQIFFETLNYMNLTRVIALLETSIPSQLIGRKELLTKRLIDCSDFTSDYSMNICNYFHLKNDKFSYSNNLLGALKVDQIPFGNFMKKLKIKDFIEFLVSSTSSDYHPYISTENHNTPNLVTTTRNNSNHNISKEIENKWCFGMIIDMIIDIDDPPKKRLKTNIINNQLQIIRYIKIQSVFPQSQEGHHVSYHWIGVEDGSIAPIGTHLCPQDLDAFLARRQLTKISSSSGTITITNENELWMNKYK